MTSRQRAALVAAIALVTALYVVWLRKPHPESLSDLRQVLVATQAWLGGNDPYQAVQAWGKWPFPLLYPFTAVLFLTPLAFLSPWAAETVFTSVSSALLAWVLTRDRVASPKLLVFASAPFIHAAVLNQWSPLLMAAALIPWAGLVLTCKPNIGLALFTAFPNVRAAASAASLVALSIALWPGWISSWRSALQHAPNSLILVTLPGGFLLLTAALKWRRPEARLLLALACIPQTTLAYEALPLFLIVNSWTEAAVLWGGTAVALLGHSHSGPYASQLAWVRGSGMWLLYCAYFPCLVAVMRRPNVPADRRYSGSEESDVLRNIRSPDEQSLL
jgi:hypothetical protein